jgi:DNA-directed RNA polymerase alpha subunit
MPGGGNWFTGYDRQGADLVIFMNIGVPGKTGHDFANHYDSDNETIVWFGKPRAHSQQPIFQKLLNGELVPQFFARWDNKNPGFTYLGIGAIVHYQDAAPAVDGLGYTTKTIKLVLACKHPEEESEEAPVVRNESEGIESSFEFSKSDNSIELLGLSERVTLCLKAQGISLVEDLVLFSESDLLGILNINRISRLPFDPQEQKVELDDRLTAIGEVRRQLQDYGLALGSSTADNKPWYQRLESVEEQHSRQGILSRAIDSMLISVRAENCLKAANVYKVRDLAKLTEVDLLKLPNLGKSTVTELKDSLAELGLALGMDDVESTYEDTAGAAIRPESVNPPTVVPSIFDGLLTIEEQLEAVLKHAVKPSARQVALLRFGWTGGEIPSLEVLGKDIGLSGLETQVTRERIRQIEAQAARSIRRSMVPERQPPALLEAIELLREQTPISESVFVSKLKSAGLTELNLTYDVLKKACELLEVEWPFVDLGIYDKGQRVITLIENLESREDIVNMLSELRKIHKGWSYLSVNQTLERLPESLSQVPDLLETVVTISPEYEWLDNQNGYFWKPPKNYFGQGNRVLYICQRIFSVAEEVALKDLVRGVSQGLRHGHPDLEVLDRYPLSEKILSEMLRQTGLFVVENDTATKATGVEFSELNSTDVRVLRAAEGLGNVINFSDFVHNAVQEGLSTGAAQLTTAHSPFLYRVSRGYYRLLVDLNQVATRELAPRGLDTVSGDDVDERLPELSYQEIFIEVDARALLSGIAKFSEPAPSAREWNAFDATGQEIGRCKIHGNRIVQIADILKRLAASKGDLIQIVLKESDSHAVFQLISNNE